MVIPASRWLRRIGLAIAVVVPTGALLWAVWWLWSLLSPQWDPRTILAIIIVAMALLAAMWWQHGWQWLLDERDPITWAALRARLPLTALPLPKTNGGRLGLGFLLLLALLWYASGQPDDKGVVTYPHASLINPILGGLGALFLIYAAIRQARTANDRHHAQTKADLQRSFTETFNKAVEQLGHERAEVRVGGIYTLERLAGEALRDTDEDSGPRLYWTIMETLTAFVRERARWQEPDTSASETMEDATRSRPEHPATDVAAALTVIGRRLKAGRNLEKKRGWQLNLRGTDLRLAALTWAHLEGAALWGAHLEYADLHSAHLSDAHLGHAHLEDAVLIRAHLVGAYLHEAHLDDADLYEAHLERANLRSAKFKGALLNLANLKGAHLEYASLDRAHLEGADLRRATGLTQAQIDRAFGDGETQLPDMPTGLTPPAHWTDPTAPQPSPPHLP